MTRYEENFKQMIVELNQTGRSVRLNEELEILKKAAAIFSRKT